MYKRERVCGGDPTVVRDELPGFPNIAVPSCSEERDFTD